MAAPIPTTTPATLTAGDTATWRIVLADYPASAGWVLTYTLINAAGKVSISSTASGDDHLVNTPAATTAAWQAGTYQWQARVAMGADAFTVLKGSIQVLPSFSAATTLDARTHAQKTLDAIEATIEGRATSATAEYEIAGRRMKYIPVPELLALRDKYRAEVASQTAAQRAAAGLPNNRRTFVRFGA